MRHLIIFLFFLIFASSCYHENIPVVTKPETLLPEEEMINILTDIYIAEGTIAYQKTQKNLPDDVEFKYYEQIFEKYGISHRVLKESMNYYNSNPKNMELLLEKVLANLSKLQPDIEKEPLPSDSVSSQAVDSATRMVQDSIQEIKSDTVLVQIQDSTVGKKTP